MRSNHCAYAWSLQQQGGEERWTKLWRQPEKDANLKPTAQYPINMRPIRNAPQHLHLFAPSREHKTVYPHSCQLCAALRLL